MLTVFDRKYLDHLGREITGKMPIGNQGDFGTYTVDYEVYFGGTLSYNLSISLTTGSSQLTLNGANWSDFGVTAGDVINLVNLKNVEETGDLNGTPTVLMTNGNVATFTAPLPALSSETYISGEFYVVKSPQAVRTHLNLIPTDQESGTASLIDGTTPTWINDSISGLTVGATANLGAIGNLSGAGITEVKISRLPDRKSGNAKAYRLHYHFYWTYFLSNLEDLFFDIDCVTPYADTMFLPQWNNPAVNLKTGFKPIGDGNSGFRDENFNQNPNNFVIDSMTWSDGTNTVAGFDYSKVSEFEIKVTSLTGGFGSYTGLIFFNDIQDKDKYSSLTTNNNGDYSHLRHTIFAENAFIDTVGTVQTFDSFIGINGEKLTISASATVVGAVMTIIGTITPNTEFIATFEDENNDEKMFTFLVREESASFGASNYSDTVNLTAWHGIGESYPPILGGYFTQAELYDHADNLIHTY